MALRHFLCCTALKHVGPNGIACMPNAKTISSFPTCIISNTYLLILLTRKKQDLLGTTRHCVLIWLCNLIENYSYSFNMIMSYGLVVMKFGNNYQFCNQDCNFGINKPLMEQEAWKSRKILSIWNWCLNYNAKIHEFMESSWGSTK